MTIDDLRDNQKVQTYLTRAMAHLEKHHPHCHGMNARGPAWYAVDFADYAAWNILRAARDLSRYAGSRP